MAKVIVERPRRQGWPSKGHGRVRDVEDLPRTQGMTRPHRMNWGGKELNENLAPLRRFLHSRVGHKWNDVYSEISQNLRVDSAVQQHVRDHVWDFVALHVTVDNAGYLWATRWTIPFKVGDGFWGLYVDPRDGVLRDTGPRPKLASYGERRAAEFADTVKIVDNNNELRKHNGIWYWCEVNTVPPGTWKDMADARGMLRRVWSSVPCWDVLLGRFVDYGERSNLRNTYCVSKRQLNHKELKTHGVQNH